jgi:acetyltransferase-like isoleucine patch superfamily enzyme
MKKYQNKSPEEVIKLVTIEIIERAIKLGEKKNRSVYISKTSGGKGVEVITLNPKTEEGRANLEEFFKPIRRHYTFHGLGKPEEKDAINWRVLNLPTWRRILLFLQLIRSSTMKGTPSKIKFFRKMGVHIGENTEIMQGVWLDHFRPELIFIGDNTLIGAFARVTVHAYEGHGRFRYGLVEIGNNCTIGAGTGMGVIRMGNNVRTLPGTTLSPYLMKVKDGAVIGWSPPHVHNPDEENAEQKTGVAGPD